MKPSYFFLFVVFYGNVLAQNRVVPFDNIKDKTDFKLDPFTNVNPDNPRLSITISDIRPTEIDELLKRLIIVDPIQPQDTVSGIKQGDTNLFFDLTNKVGRMTGEIMMLLINDGAKTLAKVDIEKMEGQPAASPGCDLSPTNFQLKANEFVNNEIKRLKLQHKSGVLVDRNKIVHIYIDQYGNQYGYGIPTAANEEYRYQVHLVTLNCNIDKYVFFFTYSGSFDPQFNIYNTFDEKSRVQPQSAKDVKFITLEYVVIGPFTNEFTIKIDREDAVSAANRKTILDSRINVAKRYYVSISAGLFGTTLKNPTGIEKFRLPSGDTTLIADDDNSVRGVLTMMATFYPNGRSFLFPPKGNLISPERLGFVVGAQLSDDLEENFFGGLSFDIARGCSLTAGVHFGRRNFVAGKNDFDFGEDSFTGELKIKKDWSAGFYFGVIVDARVIGQLFPGFNGQ